MCYCDLGERQLSRNRRVCKTVLSESTEHDIFSVKKRKTKKKNDVGQYFFYNAEVYKYLIIPWEDKWAQLTLNKITCFKMM